MVELAAVVSLLLSFSTIAGRADHKFTGFMNEVDVLRGVFIFYCFVYGSVGDGAMAKSLITVLRCSVETQRALTCLLA